jgi:hypothetical protein
LNVYDWSAGIESEDSVIDAIWTYAISTDSAKEEIVLARLGKQVPESRYQLYFERNKLIKVYRTDYPFSDTSLIREFYFDNGRVLNLLTNINKDTFLNFYKVLSDYSLKRGKLSLNQMKKQN